MVDVKKGSKLAIALIATFLVYILVYGFLKVAFVNINFEFFYYFKSVLTEKVNPSIIIVEIDDLTYNKLGFPLDRGDYMPFLDNIKKANPAVIGFDILFLDKGKDPEKDLKLANKFKELGNVVIGFDIKSNQDAIMPYELFYKSVKNIGYFKPTIDPDTSKVYSLKPFSRLNHNGKLEYLESFSFSVLREYYNFLYNKNDKKVLGDPKSSIYKFFNKNIPIRKGEFYISYKDSKYFQRESFYNVYSGNFDEKKFKEKIVLVGYTAQGVKDDFLVPGVGNSGIIKGVYVHANAINNVLNDSYIIHFDEKIEKLISFLFILFIVILNIFYLKNQTLKWISFGALSLFFLILALYVLTFIFVYKSSSIFLLPNYPFNFFSVLFLGFFISSILKYKVEDENKRLLSRALGEYVSSDIVNEILNSTGKINLSGENKKITIFFSDIAGFTKISEKLTPEELVSFLRDYLGEMSSIILDNRGFINKYEGDAIMALWGVFGTTENFGAIDACRACLLQKERLKQLNEEWKKAGKDELVVRMGLHTGPAIIGNIGASGRKIEFTALGDSVNLASRLEGVNKFYGTSICVSEEVYKLAQTEFVFRYLDRIRVKGKDIPVKIYELVSDLQEEGELKKNITKNFAVGLDNYFGRKFKEALEIFSELAQLGDNPSKVYKLRCERYLVNPPSEDWDGVWTFDEK